VTKPRIVVLVGPTGAGKTDLGIELAERWNAEIINADSRQIFRRMDIGSAKPTAEQRSRVAHHLIDLVEPDEPFDCARFRQLALAVIADITRRGKRVLVVGGSGLYVKTLLWGIFTGPARDAGVRAQLEGAEAAEPGALHRRLIIADPIAAARLHPHDRVRLIRALEVMELTGRPISAWQSEHAFGERAIDALVLGLALPRAELYARIDARCHAMVANGLVDEVKQLYADGFKADLRALRSPGYREIGDYLHGRCDVRDATARMAQATRRLAKRQLTWFRADAHVVWAAPTLAGLDEHVRQFWITNAS